MTAEIVPFVSGGTMTAEVAPPTLEQQRLDALHANLADLQGVRVMEAPLFWDIDEPVLTATRSFLETIGAGTTLYVRPEYVALTEAQHITFVPRESHGGANSSHGVMFGYFLFDNGQILSVAVKPHEDDHRQSSVKDHLSDVAVRELGLETLEPVGVLLGTEVAYSITLLEEDLTTLDSIHWQHIIQNLHEYAEFLSLWSGVARQIGLVHSIGRNSHGDLAPRNIALRPDNSNVFLIDWERSRISMVAPRDAEGRFNNSFTDLKELLESMVRLPSDRFKGGIGILTGTAEEQWAAFRALVLDEYESTRLGYAAPKEQRDVQDELTELNGSLKRHLLLLRHHLGLA